MVSVHELGRDCGRGRGWVERQPRRSRQRSQLEPLQSASQPLAGGGQAALDGPHRAAQDLSGLLVSAAFQVAQDHWCAKPIGKTDELRVQERFKGFPALFLTAGLRRAQHGPVSLVPPPPGRGRPGARTDPQSHAVEPARQRVTPPDRARLLRQDQECRLERILGVVVVVQDLMADPLYHRPMPLDQGREGRFSAPGHEQVEQLPVGEAGNRADLEKHP